MHNADNTMYITPNTILRAQKTPHNLIIVNLYVQVNMGKCKKEIIKISIDIMFLIG